MMFKAAFKKASACSLDLERQSLPHLFVFSGELNHAYDALSHLRTILHAAAKATERKGSKTGLPARIACVLPVGCMIALRLGAMLHVNFWALVSAAKVSASISCHCCLGSGGDQTIDGRCCCMNLGDYYPPP